SVDRRALRPPSPTRREGPRADRRASPQRLRDRPGAVGERRGHPGVPHPVRGDRTPRPAHRRRPRARGRRRRGGPIRRQRGEWRRVEAMKPATITSNPPPAPASEIPPPGPVARKKRMLIIVNPYATTVSDRLKNLVVYALQGRYEVEAVSTEARSHATEIGREACGGGYDVVVAFGGDGTLNEVANGVAGTDIPVTVLPGGSTNVVCRTLGIPDDVLDPPEHLLALADDFRPRKEIGRASCRKECRVRWAAHQVNTNTRRAPY